MPKESLGDSAKGGVTAHVSSKEVIVTGGEDGGNQAGRDHDLGQKLRTGSGRGGGEDGEESRPVPGIEWLGS